MSRLSRVNDRLIALDRRAVPMRRRRQRPTWWQIGILFAAVIGVEIYYQNVGFEGQVIGSGVVIVVLALLGFWQRHRALQRARCEPYVDHFGD